MIKGLSVLCIAVIGFTACDSSDYKSDKDNKDNDTASKEVPMPAPDNSAATNPSMADTAFTKNDSTKNTDTGKTHIDTVKSKKTSMRNPSRKGKVMVVADNKKDNSKIERDKEGVYNRAEIMPSFPGGEKALSAYIENNIQYPESAIDNGTEGTVVLTFAVDETGKVYAPKLASSKIGDGLEEEAMRVVSNMPKWNPGRIKGKNVKTKFTLPIHFVLA